MRVARKKQRPPPPIKQIGAEVFMDDAIHTRDFRTWGGRLFSADLDALHRVARALDMPIGWFRNDTWPHYGLPASKREMAIDLGVRTLDLFAATEMQFKLQGRLTAHAEAWIAEMRRKDAEIRAHDKGFGLTRAERSKR